MSTVNRRTDHELCPDSLAATLVTGNLPSNVQLAEVCRALFENRLLVS